MREEATAPVLMEADVSSPVLANNRALAPAVALAGGCRSSVGG